MAVVGTSIRSGDRSSYTPTNNRRCYSSANVPRYRFPLAPPSEKEEVEVKGVAKERVVRGRSEEQEKVGTGRQAYSRLTDDKRVIYYHQLPASTLPILLLRSAFSTASDGLEVRRTSYRIVFESF